MKGVLLMAYGSPESMDAVEVYYTHIRGGRRPSAEQLKDLVDRYVAIGGPSPLLKITERQAASLRSVLEDAGSETRVYAGMKHSPPFIGDVVARAHSEGVSELLCIALAPHYSRISTGGYIRAVEEGASAVGGGLKVTQVKSWHDNPLLVDLWASRVREALGKSRPGAAVVFSAHSLPSRIVAEGDPYKDQLLETSRLVSQRAGVDGWTFAFQSASKTGEPWLGPDILEHLESLFKEGKRDFVSAPIGFVSDHLEILYDLDVEATAWANENGARFVRCRSLNDSREFSECLLSLVQREGFQ